MGKPVVCTNKLELELELEQQVIFETDVWKLNAEIAKIVLQVRVTLQMTVSGCRTDLYSALTWIPGSLSFSSVVVDRAWGLSCQVTKKHGRRQGSKSTMEKI